MRILCRIIACSIEFIICILLSSSLTYIKFTLLSPRSVGSSATPGNIRSIGTPIARMSLGLLGKNISCSATGSHPSLGLSTPSLNDFIESEFICLLILNSSKPCDYLKIVSASRFAFVAQIKLF